MYDVGILNINSYSGINLAALIKAHPDLRLAAVVGRRSAGATLRALFPSWAGPDLPVLEEAPALDMVFSALPHGVAAQTLAPLVRAGTRVIDLSADFRLSDPAAYREWYGHEHPAPDLLPGAVYGLTELARDRLPGASLVACPGCYPTAAALALAPLMAEGLLDVEHGVIVDAKSGISGAGRTLRTESLFCEVDESVSAYGLEGHRHLPEIAQAAVSAAVGGTRGDAAVEAATAMPITFVPHLVPMTRGILATVYARPTIPVDRSTLHAIYQTYYRSSPCVRVSTTPPATKWTLRNNLCVVHPTVDARTGRLVIVSCLDNLVKGAAGQAIQNANLVLGLAETTGLPLQGVWP